MAFKGVTFSGQNVTPKNDGGLYNAHYGDGILWGCSMNISGDDLVIQSGEFIAGGRVCFVDGATNVDLSGRVNNTGYIQVIMNYDLSQGEGSQWYTTFVESATTTFPALTQDDINDTDTLYQFELAVIQISGGNLTNITISAPHSSLVSSGDLYVDNPDSYRDVKALFLREGTELGRIWHSVTNSYFQVNNSQSDSGLRLFDVGGAILYGNGGITLRPNGANDSTGQVYINTSGEIVGGTTLHNGTGSTSSVPASSNTVLRTASGLTTGGVYAVTGYASFTPASGTACVPSLYIRRDSTNYMATSLQSSNTTQKTLAISGFVTGCSSVSISMYSTVALTIGTAFVTAYRIA